MISIVQRLEASRTGGVYFLGDSDEAPFVPWTTLASRARRAARALRGAGVEPGEVVALSLSEPEHLTLSLLAVVYAGAIPVSLAPQRLGRSAGVASGLRATCAACLVTDDRSHDLSGTSLRILLAPEQLLEGSGPEISEHPPGETALLQLTSGSTGEPCAIAISDGNLSANVSAFCTRLSIGPEDTCVSWLPLHHDMGLVGLLFGSIWGDVKLVITSPLHFLKSPQRWLRLVSRYGGTVSFAPTFGYRLAARAASRRGADGLDLSRWRIAGCGAEPIDPIALAGFTEALAPAGFSPSALVPCYGMAEVTLAASMVVPPAGVRIVRGSVSCGRAFEGHTLTVEGERGERLAPGSVGEIVVRGPSVGRRLGEPVTGVHRTGDLGFIEDGELFVCGRAKDLVIVRGVNYHPELIERAAERAGQARAGALAAFSVPGEEGEVPVLLAEIPEGLGEEARGVLAAAVAEEVGLKVRVVRVPPRTLPKTSSGKIRRAECRDRWLRGEIGEGGRP